MSEKKARGNEAEAQRQMSQNGDAADSKSTGIDDEDGAPYGRGLTIALLAMIVPAAAVALYFYLGTPTEPDDRYAGSDLPTGHPTMSTDQAVRGLVERLKEQPGDIDDWLLLGRSMMTQGRYELAVEVFRHARKMGGNRGDLLATFGEAMVLAASGTVTAEAQQVFVEAKRMSNDPVARYYLGVAKAQAGDGRLALDIWVPLEAESPPGSVWLPPLRQRIAKTSADLGIEVASPAPNRAPPRQAPGAASAERGAEPQVKFGDHQKMVREMVTRLAARLVEQPDDVDGWLRLAQSYVLLGEINKAREAVRRAAGSAPPGDEALQADVTALSRQLGVAGTVGN